MKGSYRAYGGEWYEPRLIRRLAAPFPTTARISLGLCSFRFSAAEDLARSASFPPSIRRRPWGAAYRLRESGIYAALSRHRGMELQIIQIIGRP